MGRGMIGECSYRGSCPIGHKTKVCINNGIICEFFSLYMDAGGNRR